MRYLIALFLIGCTAENPAFDPEVATLIAESKVDGAVSPQGGCASEFCGDGGVDAAPVADLASPVDLTVAPDLYGQPDLWHEAGTCGPFGAECRDGRDCCDPNISCRCKRENVDGGECLRGGHCGF